MTSRLLSARRGVAVALVFVLALVAYGAAGAGAAASSKGGRIHSGTSLSDIRIAHDAGLRQSDLPPGWSGVPAVSLTTGLNCPGLTRAKAAADARAISPAFQSGQNEAASGIDIYADSAAAKHWFALLSSARTRSCIGHVLARVLRATGRSQGVAVAVSTHSAIIQPVGDQDVADRIFVRLSAAGATEQAYLDLIFVRVGRGIAIFSLASVGTVFDQGLEPKLLRTVAGRLATGLGGGDVTPAAAP